MRLDDENFEHTNISEISLLETHFPFSQEGKIF